MSDVVLIDSDTRALDQAARVIVSAGYTVDRATNGRTGLEVATIGTRLLAVGRGLPDLTTEQIVATTRAVHPAARIVAVRVATCRRVVACMRSGADDCMPGPLDSVVTLRLLLAEIRLASRRPVAAPVSHAAHRWARLIAGAIDSPEDLPTLADWSRFLGVSVGALRAWCQGAGLKPRQSLRFMRLLRAVLVTSDRGLSPWQVLNVADSRTLARLILLGGGVDDCLPTDVDEFVRRQMLIRDPVALDALRQRIHSEER